MEVLTTKNIIDIVDKMSQVIIENEVCFCDLDSVAGDGDFGMSISKGFKQLKKEWHDLSKEDIGAFLKDSSMIITEYCGGASGPIWGSAFRGGAKSSKGKEEITVAEFSDLMFASVAAIQKRGNAQLGDKTLLDALIPAANAIKDCSTENKNILEALERSAAAARQGAEMTKKMSAKKGRASYVGDRSLDHPDAGAMALGIIFTEISKFMSK